MGVIVFFFCWEYDGNVLWGISHRTGCNITIYNMGTFPVDVEPNQLKFLASLAYSDLDQTIPGKSGPKSIE